MPPVVTLEVIQSTDVAEARRQAGELAEKIGFPPVAVGEIALVVSELASNLVRHAKGGTLLMVPLNEPDRSGLEIQSMDAGPGISDIEEAMRDGYSTAGSLGYGLGVVNRLMDELDVSSRPSEGTRIVCRRWIRRQLTHPDDIPLTFGVASRAHPQMNVNGDAFAIKHWHQNALVGLIDGLGHGTYAHRAAQTARSFVEGHHDQPIESIFRGVSRVCRATRGVVMALARFDCAAGKLRYASVGNVEARIFGCAETTNFMVRRGVLGGLAPAPAVTDHAWRSSNMMVMHTDGVSTRWRWSDFPEIETESAPVIAQRLLRTLAKPTDDATVLVVRGKSP